MTLNRLAIVLAAALSLAAPAAASATTYCVQAPGCVGTPKSTLEQALGAAEVDTAPDRIELGPGDFVAPTTNGFRAPNNPVDIEGAGYSTTLTGPVNTNWVLALSDPDSSVSYLAIAIPQNSDGNTKYGLSFYGKKASHLWITASQALTTVAIGADVNGAGVLEWSSIILPANLDTQAVSTDGGGTIIRNNTISARDGVQALGPHVHFDRNRITATNGNAIQVANSDVDVEATNSLLQLVGKSTGVYVGTSNNLDAGITARNVTILGDGTLGSTGVLSGSNTAHTASLTLDSSIVRGVQYPRWRNAGTGQANLTALYSDYDHSKFVDNGPGTLTEGPGNIDTDPLFGVASETWHPTLASPAIDAGNPADFADTLDLDGELRAADGTGTCKGRRDMGAFELNGQPSPPCPDPPSAPPVEPPAPPAPPAIEADRTAPSITGLKLSRSRFAVSSRKTALAAGTRRGTRFSFRLSENADVSIVIERRGTKRPVRYRRVGTLKRHSSAGSRRVDFSGRLGKRALCPGRYRAVVTARDAAGNRSRAYRVAFKIVR